MPDDTTTHLPVAGLDVHAAAICLAVVLKDELLDARTLPLDRELVERELRRLGATRVCYKAGPTGFGLARRLRAAGLQCDVIAPGLVPRRSSDRVKTDTHDARKLALLYQGGMLAPIWVPSLEQEAVRDLIRARPGRPSGSRSGAAATRRVRAASRSAPARQGLDPRAPAVARAAGLRARRPGGGLR